MKKFGRVPREDAFDGAASASAAGIGPPTATLTAMTAAVTASTAGANAVTAAVGAPTAGADAVTAVADASISTTEAMTAAFGAPVLRINSPTHAPLSAIRDASCVASASAETDP